MRKSSLPTLVAAFVSAWWGIDFLCLRDEANPYLYYGVLDSLKVLRVAALIGLAGSVLMVMGLMSNNSSITRLGYTFVSAQFGIFSLGFLLNSLIVGHTPAGDGRWSAASPGMTYGLLSIWMLLTALARWDPEHDPHR